MASATWRRMAVSCSGVIILNHDRAAPLIRFLWQCVAAPIRQHDLPGMKSRHPADQLSAAPALPQSA
jgi:hypothetical protein